MSVKEKFPNLWIFLFICYFLLGYGLAFLSGNVFFLLVAFALIFLHISRSIYKAIFWRKYDPELDAFLKSMEREINYEKNKEERGAYNHSVKKVNALETRINAIIENSSNEFALLVEWTSLFKTELEREKWFSRDTLQELLHKKPGGRQMSSDFTLILQHPNRDHFLGKLSEDERSALLFWSRKNLNPVIRNYNESCTRREMERCAEFFHTVERAPLTEEQRSAVICFDNRVQVVAAAGSGKTSTMVAKAGYAVERGLAKSDEILMLAFNKSTAKELDQRVKNCLKTVGIASEDIRGTTFHALGLEIIGKATGRKPRLARFIDQNQELPTILKILSAAVESSDAIRSKLTLLRYVFSEDLPEFGTDGANYDAWDQEARARGFLTLKGDIVKSQEERIIADWLYIHGISYRYEHPYVIDVADSSHSQYMPDFYYPEIDLYHEHFALDAAGAPPSLDNFEGYMDSVLWKRDLHLRNETQLFETTSAGIRSGNDLEKLMAKLRESGLNPHLRHQVDAPRRLPVKEQELARTLRTLLSHVKSNRLTIADLRDQIVQTRTNHSTNRHRLILDIFEAVWDGWENELAKEKAVDFDDMLNQATDLVESGRYESSFRLVLVDEFQDVSHARASLLKALTAPPHHYLFAVGDDWQSINRFAGADVSVMTDFDEVFGDGQTVKLQETFRCPPSLASLASRFVSENPAQVDKEVRSRVEEPEEVSLQGFIAENEDGIEQVIESYICRLYERLASKTDAGEHRSLLILGRYRHNRPARLTSWQRKFGPLLDIEYSTIHAAKGLEADFVCVAPMNSGRYGFPSTIEDDPVLLLAMPHADDFPFAEERRLFYVAVTRAKRMVALFAPEERRSQFFNTLVAWGIAVHDASGNEVRSVPCDECGKGQMVCRDGPYGLFLACDRFPRCAHTKRLT